MRVTQAGHGVTLVDDEPCALDVLSRAARQWNFACQSAASAEEAISLLEKKLTPIVVTDIRMPGRGGVWLVQEIRRRWPEVGIIVITAGHEQDLVPKCLEAGAHHFFLKPFDLDEFHHALEATGRNVQLQRKNKRQRDYLKKAVRCKTRKIRRTYISAIDSLIRTLEARDPYTSGHSIRVREYVAALAQRIGLDDRICRHVGLAAKLHDIGKVSLSEAILNKTGPLTKAEVTVVQKHPQIGERIVSPIVRSPAVRKGIRNHHERYDGEGYPDRLRGRDIPLTARLIAVADCFDALTSSRAYRQALTAAEAVEVIRAGSGSQFDPKLVAPFVELVLEGRLVLFDRMED